ncbi:MAG: hypothetical protein Q4A78_03100 [Peptostreptococcaceae bacterium]|nr:hypothetical protein [Peptostreptococcaceae bacterium]
MNLKNMLRRLTWNYNKEEGSNVYKLFATIAPEVENLKEIFEKIESWRGIENAEGTTLDLIGEDVRQERLSMSDEQYRPMLRFRSSINRSNTDINSVNTALSAITEGSFIRLYEAYGYEDVLEPAAIIAELRSISPTLPFSEMERIIAAGVRLIWEKKRKDQMNLYLGIATRKLKDLTIYPSTVEDMEKEKKLYLGVAMSKRKEHILYPATAEDMKLSMPLKFSSRPIIAKESSVPPLQFSMLAEMGFSKTLLLIDGGEAVRMERKSLVKEGKILE